MFASPRPAAHPSHPASTLRSGRRRRIGAGLLALGLALVGTTPVRAAITAASGGGTGAGAVADPAAAYGQLPLSFEANHGQTDPKVRYLTHGRGYDLFITPTETVMALHGSAAPTAGEASGPDSAPPAPAAGAALRLSMVGANPDAEVIGADQLPGRVNYLIGADPAGWHTDIPTYRRVNLTGVYPGVDVAWYGGVDGLEYDLVVAPGADPTQIRLAVEGADGPLRLDDHGQLIIDTAAGTVIQHAPVAYQQTAGGRRPISSSYVLAGDDQIGFTLGAYDPSLPLVIDPVLVYSTYLGGSGSDRGFGIAVDGTGAAYVTGATASFDFPVVPPGVPGACTGTCGTGANLDAFVTKIAPGGASLAYSTYLGGSGSDRGAGIAVDGTGAAYVTGATASDDFPVVPPGGVPGACTGTCGTGAAFDAFVTKIAPGGASLAYSTYLGGSSSDRGFGIAVDGTGAAYVTGDTASFDFPVVVPPGVPGACTGTCGIGANLDAFVVKISFVADVAVAKTGPAEATVGAAFDYTVTVTNAGPDTAEGVVVTDTLPAGVEFVSATASQGGPCTEAGGVVTCPLGSIASGGAATVTITVVPTAPGPIVNAAAAFSEVDDPDLDDNIATAETVVVAAAPDDDDDPYDTYDDDPGDPGFDFDSPFDGAGGPGATPGAPVDVSASTGGSSSGDAVDNPTVEATTDVAVDPFTVDAGGPALLSELPRTGVGVAGTVAVGGFLVVVGGVLRRKRHTGAV